ncbi:MAG: antitoxin [Anaerolineae bacterium]|nr:antitoxin [Anaerolineae bacterium]
MQTARTTVTLDPDVRALLKRVMRERDIPFKQALNEAVRIAFGVPNRMPRKRYRLKPRNMGFNPNINWDKANQLAAAMEDEEIIRKMQMGK